MWKMRHIFLNKKKLYKIVNSNKISQKYTSGFDSNAIHVVIFLR